MENTKKNNFDKICRTCLLESPVLVSLKTKMENSNRTLYDVLLFVLNNNISADSSLPKQICNECEVLLCKVEEFKTRCYDSEKVIKDMIESQSRPTVKLESSSKLDVKSSVERYYELNPVNIIRTVNEDAKIKKFETEDKDSKVELNDVIKEEFTDDFSDDFDDFFEDHEQKIPLNIESHTCLCGKVFNDLNQYQTHLDSKNCSKSSKNDLLSIPAKCEECNVVFKNTKAFKIHVKVHNTDKPYQCELCTKKFKKKSSFLTHIDSKICKAGKSKIKKKNTPKAWFLPTKCEECGTVFESMKLFKEHACIHLHNNKTQEYFQCSLCMRKFKKKSSLVTHLKNHEEKDNLKYTCDICKREFKYQAHLDNHNNLEHNTKKTIIPLVLPVEDTNNSDKKHRCKICSKSFTMLSTLTDHMRTHTGERPFLCSVCGRGFTQKTNLAQHMRRHLGLKPFKCNECETRFVSKGELDAHTRKHSGAHPFVCDECGNGFTTSSSLRKHKRVHTGERPYACDLCPMKFAVSGTLKSHRRTHTGEKPYQCSYCEKAFVQRQDLVSHIRCHTGERPFACGHCGQAFRKASALKAHTKTHRPGVMGLPTMQGMQNS